MNFRLSMNDYISHFPHGFVCRCSVRLKDLLEELLSHYIAIDSSAQSFPLIPCPLFQVSTAVSRWRVVRVRSGDQTQKAVLQFAVPLTCSQCYVTAGLLAASNRNVTQE